MNDHDKRERRRLARERLRRLRERARQREAALKKAAQGGGDANGAAGASKAARASAERAAASAAKDAERKRKIELEQLEREVNHLSQLSDPTGASAAEIERLRKEVTELKQEFYAHLNAWQRLQIARHPQRPYTDDFIRLLFEDFSEIHGDRNFADDTALITGMARFHCRPVLIVGNQKGRDTKQRVARNFGQAKPEGYRKALRAMRLAAKFERPIFVFVDTPGAYPGVDAEERGQAEAIAFNIREMTRLPVPIIVSITGEGGSGGALAIAVGDRVLMLENSVYSVISPEGCASIMWRDSTKAETAAEALRISAPEILELKLADEIVPEPEGGAHTDHAAAAKLLDGALTRVLGELSSLSPSQLLAQRYNRYRHIGQFFA